MWLLTSLAAHQSVPSSLPSTWQQTAAQRAPRLLRRDTYAPKRSTLQTFQAHAAPVGQPSAQAAFAFNFAARELHGAAWCAHHGIPKSAELLQSLTDFEAEFYDTVRPADPAFPHRRSPQQVRRQNQVFMFGATVLACDVRHSVFNKSQYTAIAAFWLDLTATQWGLEVILATNLAWWHKARGAVTQPWEHASAVEGWLHGQDWFYNPETGKGTFSRDNLIEDLKKTEEKIYEPLLQAPRYANWHNTDLHFINVLEKTTGSLRQTYATQPELRPFATVHQDFIKAYGAALQQIKLSFK